MSGNDGRAGPTAWYVPTGRIRRSDWWLRYVLLFALIGVAASVVDAHWFPGSWPRFTDRPDQADVADLVWFFPEEGGPVTAVTALLLAVPNVASTVTRLHDRDHSAWWLLWALVPGIGWLVLLVTCGFLGTQPRPNRYGPPPT
ncbi:MULTISPECIES: DUF805 domain-containing protein [unclassified Modestobacter]